MDGDDELRTARLRLRPWTVADAGLQRRLWAERDPRVPAHRRISDDGHPTIAEFGARLRTYEPVPAPGLLVVEALGTATPLGYCGLTPNSVENPTEPELAYEFLRDHWGNGYATEAARAVADQAASIGYTHLASTVRAWNTASLRVLAKLGFVDTGEREVDPVHGDSILLRLRLR